VKYLKLSVLAVAMLFVALSEALLWTVKMVFAAIGICFALFLLTK
jgi:hypothetical protein